MKRNALAIGIATLIGGLGFVGVASADVIVGTGVPSATTLGAVDVAGLWVAPGGVGHALIAPYFNAQNGNATLISVVNADTVNGKATKIRFRGAANSDDILDFTVLLSPGDVWNATVTAAAGDNPATITTNDKTCTLPQLAPGVPQAFVTTRLTTKGGSNINNNTREGYVEIFAMADIPSAALYGSGSSQSDLYTAIQHVDGVPSCDSSAINPAILDTNWTAESDAAAQGLASPTGGLFGNWVIINVPQTTTYSGSMTAISSLFGGNTAAFRLFPQSASAYTGTIANVTADPLLRSGSWKNMTPLAVGTNPNGAAPITAAYFDMPDMSTPFFAPAAPGTPELQAAWLGLALAVPDVMNEYMTDPSVSGKTDWVFSMPSRRYQVAMDYSPSTPQRLFTAMPVGGQYFHDLNTAINPLNISQICVSAQNQTFLDREEGTKSSGAVFSPGNITVTRFCGETSVLSFADTGNSALSASVTRQDTGSSAFVNGWGSVNVDAGLGNVEMPGLPILGYSFMKATNPAVATGQSGTYGLTFEHRSTRRFPFLVP